MRVGGSVLTNTLKGGGTEERGEKRKIKKKMGWGGGGGGVKRGGLEPPYKLYTEVQLKTFQILNCLSCTHFSLGLFWAHHMYIIGTDYKRAKK